MAVLSVLSVLAPLLFAFPSLSVHAWQTIGRPTTALAELRQLRRSQTIRLRSRIESDRT
jgi:hypothetical protein